MRFWLYLSMLLCLIATDSFADQINDNHNEVYPSLSESTLQNYITIKNYNKVVIDDDYGNLISESLILQYTPKGLTRFLNNKVCNNIYWFNCSANLQNVQQFININLEEESSLIRSGINKISAYRIKYTTVGMDNSSHITSGSVLIPKSDHPLKGVVIFYHYTVLNKHNAPSNIESDETQFTRTVAATIASSGYVVVMPDYIGIGADESSVHPYILYPQNNALSGLYMLKAIESIESNVVYHKLRQKIPLFITGYSEGGSYALWAAKILQDNPTYLNRYNYHLTKTVPMSGAYNLSKVTFGFLLDSSPVEEYQPPFYIENFRVSTFLRPALVINALDAFVNYSLKSEESTVFSPSFGDCRYCLNSGESYTVSKLLSDNTISEFNKYKLLYDASSDAGYNESNSSVIPIIESSLLRNNDFKQQLISADIDNWRSNSPIDFIALENDSVVTRLNSEVAYYGMAKSGSNLLTITLVPNQNFKASGYIPLTDIDIDHGSAIPYMFLFARKSFDESLNNAKSY